MPAWLIPAGIAAGQLLGGLFGSKKQADYNKELAEYQNDWNYRMWVENNEYNSPASQMQRFKEAGLNPNLIYGQGNPGNSSAPVRSADIKPADLQSAYQVAPLVNQTAMTQSQVQALDARTRKDTVIAQLNKLQSRILEQNPALHADTLSAMMDTIKTNAELAATNVQLNKKMLEYQNASMGWQVQKVMNEVKNLEQRFKLNELDAQIKAQVLESKEFQNAILEVQKKWLVDGDMGPEQYLQLGTQVLGIFGSWGGKTLKPNK